MRKRRKRTVRERSMALVRRRERRRLKKKRQEKGHNWRTSLMVYAPNIQAMFRKSKKKNKGGKDESKRRRKGNKGLWRRKEGK